MALCTLSLVLLLACGGDGEDDGSGSPTPEDTDLDSETTAEPTADTGTTDPPEPTAVTGSTASTAATASTASTASTGDTGLPTGLIDDTLLGSAVRCGSGGVSMGIELLVDGDAVEAVVDMADSANFANWNEYHTVPRVDFDMGVSLLSLSGVETQASVVDWQDGVATVFACTPHIDDPAVMSYIARAYDSSGMLLDCVAWGQDPVGMVAGAYFNYNPPIDPGELVGCRIPQLTGP